MGGPIRMRRITKQHTGERTVKITEKVFRGNFTTPKVVQPQTKTFWGISLFYWVLIGSITGAVLVLVIIAGICGFKRNKTARLEAKLEDNSERFEEITEEEEEPVRFKELEGRLSIEEQQALAAKRIE